MNLSSEVQAQIRDFTVWSKVSTVQSRSEREEGPWECLRPGIPEFCIITCPLLVLSWSLGVCLARKRVFPDTM